MKRVMMMCVAMAGCLAFGSVAVAQTDSTQLVMVEKVNGKDEIAIAEVPTAIQEDVKKTWPDAKIVKAFRETDATGKVLAFELVLDKAGEQVTVAYDGEGKRK